MPLSSEVNEFLLVASDVCYQNKQTYKVAQICTAAGVAQHDFWVQCAKGINSQVGATAGCMHQKRLPLMGNERTMRKSGSLPLNFPMNEFPRRRFPPTQCNEKESPSQQFFVSHSRNYFCAPLLLIFVISHARRSQSAPKLLFDPPMKLRKHKISSRSIFSLGNL